MRVEPDEEMVARQLMSRAMGVPVERHDDGCGPGQFDFEFMLSDGRSGAAEMTPITHPGDRQWSSYRRYGPTIADSRWAWHFRRRGEDVSLKLLMQHLQVLAPPAERYDEPDLCALARRPELMNNESARWLRAIPIDIDGLRGHSEPGTVFFSGDSNWAFIGDKPSLDPMLDWLEAELATERFNGDFSKINTSGCDEQHLVLRIDLGNAIPDEHALRLIDPSTSLPTRPPDVLGRRLTGLWLIPEWGHFFTYWTADDGWRRFHDDPSAGSSPGRCPFAPVASTVRLRIPIRDTLKGNDRGQRRPEGTVRSWFPICHAQLVTLDECASLD